MLARSHGEAVASHPCHADPEQPRFNVGQSRDVVGHSAIVEISEPVISSGYQSGNLLRGRQDAGGDSGGTPIVGVMVIVHGGPAFLGPRWGARPRPSTLGSWRGSVMGQG